MREPVQALTLYASLLEGRMRDQDALRIVRGIQLSLRSLELLLDGLIEVSRIESGTIRPAVVAFPLMPLIERVVELQRPLAEHKGLRLRAARTAACVRSDPLLLERVLSNLVSNVIHCTERGGVVIGCRRAAGGRLHLQVAHSGASEHEDRQLEKAGAQGVGIAVVRGLSGLLGHPLSFNSVGRGSVSSIELERAEAVPAEGGDLLLAALRDLTVLLIEDDAGLRDNTRRLLQGWGCRCIAGASAAEVEAGLEAAGGTADVLIIGGQADDETSALRSIARLRSTLGAPLPALVLGPATRQGAPGKLRAFLSQIPQRQPTVS